VVGRVHLAHCFGVSQAGLRAICISRRAFFVGGRRGDHVSGVESICLHYIPQREQGIANGVVFAGVGVGADITPAMITYVMIH
jgi:hypothetical protein